jgi:hypothetical protein
MSPVRGTTAWKHAIIQKKIINRDEGGNGRVTSSGTHYVICAWSDCENDATTVYETRVHNHASHVPCDSRDGRHMTYAFCSERHKQMWLDEARRGMM